MYHILTAETLIVLTPQLSLRSLCHYWDAHQNFLRPWHQIRWSAEHCFMWSSPTSSVIVRVVCARDVIVLTSQLSVRSIYVIYWDTHQHLLDPGARLDGRRSSVSSGPVQSLPVITQTVCARDVGGEALTRIMLTVNVRWASFTSLTPHSNVMTTGTMALSGVVGSCSTHAEACWYQL